MSLCRFVCTCQLFSCFFCPDAPHSAEMYAGQAIQFKNCPFLTNLDSITDLHVMQNHSTIDVQQSKSDNELFPPAFCTLPPSGDKIIAFN